MAEDWARWQGQVVGGEFRLDRYLGGSEHSGVFLTEFGGKPAAIKLLPDQMRAEWGAGLSHPHLIQIFSTGRSELDGVRFRYVVSEYAEEVLSQVIPERVLAPDEARETIAPVVEALTYLHQRGIVHGHVKPSNIVSAREQLKIASDGLRKDGEPGIASDARGAYDAPEMALGRISPAADVWSLGVTLVEILTQQLPVKNGAGDPVLPESLPPEFREIAAHCLDPDPQQRWSLSRVVARLSPGAQPAATAQVITMPARRVQPDTRQPYVLQRRYLMGAIGIAVAVIVILAGTLVFRPSPGSPPQAAAPPEASREASPVAPEPNYNKPSPAGRIRGRVATDSKPDISRKARETIQGTVRVRVAVRVDPSGRVVEAKLDTPHVSRYFGSASLQAARRWRFEPPTVEGRAVNSSWVIEFDYSRTGTSLRSRETT